MINRVNPYSKLFENFRAQLENNDSKDLSMYIHRDTEAIKTRSKSDAKRYNTNAASGQIAAIFTTDDDGFPPDIYVNILTLF